ncbi:TonB-dependent receptor [Ravibacter arvi]|uniref:TonB-dependent receptor n=1 Tax=Ravibacter arvi TaxID=2051041 RepID=A0ABP8M9K3_9BACT
MTFRWKPAVFCALSILCNSAVPTEGQTLAYGVISKRQSEKKALLSLREFLMELQRKKGVNIVFSDTQLTGKTVALSPGDLNGDVGLLLQTALKDTGLQVIKTRKDTFLIIKNSQPAFPDESAVPLRNESARSFFTLVHLSRSLPSITPVFAKRIISGLVTDETGSPLPGVNILVKGTSQGTTTDIQGKYELTIPDDVMPVLVFSFVGFLTKEEIAEGRSQINVMLQTDNKSLEEVVVIGYGSSRKKDVVGALDIVSVKDAGANTATNPAQLLIGKSAGVQILQSNGNPGADAQILIRGTGSFTGVDPLYVIDGIQGNKTMFNTLAAQDIENITILKDASSTAIYGSAAANGVVIITTKKGRLGTPRITLNTQWGVASAWKRLDLLNASQYVDLLQDFAATANSTLPDKFKTADTRTDRTNWQDEIFRNALVSQNDFNISGGSEKINYNFSVSYISQQAIVKDYRNNRLNARLALQEDFGRVRLGQALNVRYIKDRGNRASIYNAVYYAPYKPVYDESIPGGFSNTTNVDDFSNGDNPLANVYLNKPKSGNYVLFPQVYGEIDLFKGLRFRTQLSAEIGGGRSESYQYYYLSGNNLSQPQRATLNFNNYAHYTLENYFSYNRTFGNHSISATLGNSYLDPGNTASLNGTGSNIPNDNIQNISVAQSQAVTGSTYGYARSAIISYFGRAGYTFNEKYILSASYRRDGASNFGANNRFGNFYGLGLAWRFVDETFVSRGLPFLSDGKLRLGLGRTGNNTIPTTGITSVLTFSGDPNGNLVYSLGTNEGFVSGTTIRTLSNPNIKWESTDQTDIGLDLAFMNNRLTVALDWYNRKSSGLLVRVPVSGSTGASISAEQPSKYANAASAQNKGVELAVGYRDDAGKGFLYNISANFSYNKNIVNSLGDEFAAPIQAGAFSNLPAFTYTAAGSPIGSFYGHRVSHVARDQAEIDALNQKARENSGQSDAVYQSGLLPGDFIFKDLDGDGKVTATDREILGNPIPRFLFGFNAGFNYRSFDFNLVLSGVAGLHLLNAFKFVTHNEATGHNTSTAMLDRWRQPGDNASLPRAGQSATGDGNLRPSDWWLENGSYARLRNITLGYSFPKSMLSSIGNGKVFSTLRIYVAAQNLFTITNYSGYDPEVSTQNDGNYIFSRGIDDRQQLPQPRTFLGGLQIGF